ncbi:LysR family transcriptional regulator [Delftia sp. UME58]|uniref:LysR family transcriptional regulator n=1 Tax=Delftia sp. UME58 TaxID=1862322 RepID=UPI00160427A3|nr:LysR family transcriptional regulator [Delftia sp. UME58]MBB1653271.1 LysR family transcriptional regulator [Delftia sp. UME58]
MIDFKSLETFLWVVNLGSFSAAASKLATTQPAVSHRIAQLEQSLGVRLLNRDNKTVSPTAAGRKLLGYAERTVKLRSEIVASIRNPDAIEGTLRLGIVETLVHTWLSELIRRVEKVYPRLNLEIQSDITWEMGKKLANQEIDLAFVMGPLNSPVLINRFLCDYPMAFIASPEMRIPKPATIQDIARFRMLTFPRRTQPYEILRAVFNEPALGPVRIHSANALTPFIQLATEGFGILVAPPAIALDRIESGELELIPTGIMLPNVSFTATWLNSPDTLAIELVAEIAVELARESQATYNL